MFQYWKSTQNGRHVPPSSDAAIDRMDQANHQYDLRRFRTALANHNLQAVRFLKARSFGLSKTTGACRASAMVLPMQWPAH